MLFRPDGGIGRRAGLKHQWIHFHAGSTPAPGTKPDFSFTKSESGFFICSNYSDNWTV
jgi:hypothetical protein